MATRRVLPKVGRMCTLTIEACCAFVDGRRRASLARHFSTHAAKVILRYPALRLRPRSLHVSSTESIGGSSASRSIAPPLIPPPSSLGRSSDSTHRHQLLTRQLPLLPSPCRGTARKPCLPGTPVAPAQV